VLASLILWAGGVLLAGGAIASMPRRTRRRGGIAAAAGLLMVIIALALPAREKQATARAAMIDEWMPVWQFDERHEIDVAAPPEKVYRAIHEVRANEIFLFKTLVGIRRGFRKTKPSILNPSEDQPLLDVATKTTFLWLTDAAPREMVVGTVIAAPVRTRPTLAMFRKTLPHGYALATMNFVVTPNGQGSHVTTETRVYANDAQSIRAFKIYWRIIRPGSGIIRQMWLRAVKRRAENGAAA